MLIRERLQIMLLMLGLFDCMKKKHYLKKAERKYHIFLIFVNMQKYHIFCKTKIKENIIFPIISDIFRNKSIGQDFDNTKLTR